MSGTYTIKTLGILGGGQLGRMSALAAARLGISTHIFAPEDDPPAGRVATHTTQAPYDNKAALKKFAQSVDVITYEFENIPVETVRYLQKLKPVFPDDRLLEIAQNRVAEKQFLNDIGIPTTRWKAVMSAPGIAAFLDEVESNSCIVKTCRFGYDGKGQIKINRDQDISERLKELGNTELIAEEIFDFACEISVIIARDKLGQSVCYTPALNEHRDHILARSVVPAPLPRQILDQAVKQARLLADAVDLVGVLGLEYFVGSDGTLLANEIAPRTHNSGHWTLDACAVSQFEQHVRTVCGLPAGIPERHSDAEMRNLIGRDIRNIGIYLEMSHTCVHIYGKEEIKEGRKMGHVTILRPLNEYPSRFVENDDQV